MYIVFVGPPGAGKGTQSKRLVTELGIAHLSTGDLLRDACRSGTAAGREVCDFLDRGQLVPDDLVIDVVAERLEDQKYDPGCLFDGFPRTVAQAKQLDRILTERGRPLRVVIELIVDTSELLQRILKRSTIENRTDDTPETIRERLQIYAEQTSPVLDHYRQSGAVASVDGMGSTDEVFARIMGAIPKPSE